MKKNALILLIILLTLILPASLVSSDPGDRSGFPPPGFRPDFLPGRMPERPPWGPTEGESWEGRPGPSPEPLWWHHLPVSDLNEEQIDKIKAIERRLAKEEIPKGAELEVIRIELEEILDQVPVDLKAVEIKLKKVEALRTSIQMAQIRAGQEIKSLLTPAQKKALKQFARYPLEGDLRLKDRKDPRSGRAKKPGRPEDGPPLPRK